jgi:hypothetical protein
VSLSPLEHYPDCAQELRIVVRLFGVAGDIDTIDLVKEFFKLPLGHLIVDGHNPRSCLLQKISVRRLKKLCEEALTVLQILVMVPFKRHRLSQNSDDRAILLRQNMMASIHKDRPRMSGAQMTSFETI